MRLVTLLVLVATLLGIAPAWATADTRAGCDACALRVDSLDQPVKLHGTWLFTRDDAPGNAAAELDTTSWKLVKAPGPWKHVYNDGKSFPVGWYRGTFHFAPSMVGQEVVLLVNTYMARTQVFVDGQEVYLRPNALNTSRYYSIQAIPVRFKVTKVEESIAMRVETPLMTGVYQLPFELRHYDQHDGTLVFYQVWGGEARAFAAYVMLFFSFFFLLVFLKVRYPLYLVAAGACFTIFPFFALPGDYLVALFPVEKLVYLHYTGLFSGFFFYLFSQFFHKFTPRINKYGGAAFLLMAITIGSMAIHPNLDLFQHVRSIYFVVLLLCGLGALYNYGRGIQAGKHGSGVLFFGMLCYVGAGVNDLLLALGAIASISMIFTGVAMSLLTMLYVASSSFADTFVENKRLVADLTGLNENLESLVAQRTLALRQKTQDIQSMLQNMPQGVLTIVQGNRVHPEYSAYLETIFETTDVAERDVMDLVFAASTLGADSRSQVEVAIASCIGEDEMNYEFNAHLLASECDIGLVGGNVKSLELSWSPITNEDGVVEKLMLCVRDVTELKRLAGEASAQKRELEMIGEILAVSQEKFQGFIQGSLEFVDENQKLIEGASASAPELVTPLFRNMHTIKGNARTFGLLHLTNIVHEAEQAYDDLRNGRTDEFKPTLLLEQLESVRHQIEEYAKINDHTLGRKGPGRRGAVDKFLLVDKAQVAHTIEQLGALDKGNADAMRDAIAGIEKMLRQIGAERMATLIEPVVESLPSLAKELGKEPPVVQVRDNDLLVKNQIGGLLKNLFTHLLRNAVDHGLETPPARAAAHKPAQGRIELTLAQSDDQFLMVLRDDGQGMALARIRQRAAEHGIATAEALAAMPDDEVAQLVFLPGFSTAERITEVSGRGVGMDAVKGFLENEGGAVEIRFTGALSPDGFRPFEIVITLPGRFAVAA
jgi:HPt (histidine-containing phosphotransfer) domain-containing protein